MKLMAPKAASLIATRAWFRMGAAEDFWERLQSTRVRITTLSFQKAWVNLMRKH